jgi:hypothetical protein
VLEGGADDEAIGERQKVANIGKRHAAAQQHFCGWTGTTNAFDIGKVRGHACAHARNDEGIGETAFKCVAGGIFDRQIAERHSMFHEDVRKDLSLGTELMAVSECVVGIAFDQTLVGEHCAGVNVDADEASAARGTKRQRSAGVVAKDVEADGQLDRGANGTAGGSHRGDGFVSDVCFGKRNVTEVFDEKRVSTSAFVAVGISNGGGDYLFQVTLPARRAREGMEVDDTDEKLVTLVKEMGQKG